MGRLLIAGRNEIWVWLKMLGCLLILSMTADRWKLNRAVLRCPFLGQTDRVSGFDLEATD
jgi:hypothetical protein